MPRLSLIAALLALVACGGKSDSVTITAPVATRNPDGRVTVAADVAVYRYGITCEAATAFLQATWVQTPGDTVIDQGVASPAGDAQTSRRTRREGPVETCELSTQLSVTSSKSIPSGPGVKIWLEASDTRASLGAASAENGKSELDCP